jgi:hypothetical protein
VALSVCFHPAGIPSVEMDPNISSEALRRAATIQDQIEFLRAEIARILLDKGGAVSSQALRKQFPPARRKKRRMSAEAREKIAAAQRKRWARVRAGK